MKLAKLFVAMLCVAHISSAQDAFNKGKAALAVKDTAAAVAAFKDALKQGQKSGETNNYLGQIAFEQERIDDAISYLTTAVRIDDENVDALITLGQAYVEKKDNNNAIMQFKRAQKIAPKDCRVPLAYGIALVEAGVLDGPENGIVQLRRAEECDPKNPMVYIAQGDAYNKQGGPPMAITMYQKAMEIAPNDLNTLMKIARTFVRNRKWGEAVQAFTKAVDIDSTNFDAYMEAGKILFRAKQFGRAAQFLNKAYKLRPKNVEAVSLYSQSLAESQIWVEAAKVSAEAVKLDSNNTENWRAYGQALAKTRDFKTALLAYGRVMKKGAMHGEDSISLAEAYFNTQQEDKALALYLDVITRDSTNCDPYFNLGFLYMKKQDYANASKMFEKKIECDPKSLTAYINAGTCYMQAPKNLPRARELFLKAIEMKPDYLGAKLWLARYYAEVDSIEQMKRTYDDVIDIATKEPAKYKKELGEAYMQLGSYYYQKQQYPSAVETFRRASAAGVDNSGLQLAWGIAIMQTLGDNPDEREARTADAVKKFRRVVQLEASNAQGHFWLGNTLLMQRREGDTPGNKKLQQEACAEFVKALKLDPRLGDAKKAMERVGCK
ncbi:MAG: tetratricopeptide repeat protein [Ignavibacteriae bacterium]|nr:tetratricopeptide repeat protein [Ignavibacteriota bacterium]